MFQRKMFTIAHLFILEHLACSQHLRWRVESPNFVQQCQNWESMQLYSLHTTMFFITHNSCTHLSEDRVVW